MKTLKFAIFLILIAACASQQNIQIKATDTVDTEDSVSYELIVLDPGFESWFLTYSKPSWYHSQQYYETWNEQYVNAWNYNSIWHRNARLLDGQIDYNPQIDYGLDINHKLFYYFQYVENELKIRILSNSPRAI
ncbi:DUF6146 family protein [Sunxiuqinia elliptica]|uniref:Lipoprotein n=1 Tax=Sunxiuqinia elliptica TaxID=655355 RepID=A0A4R6H6K7_9BACT|nr:DUF6146 family protein [Sunxiuqinia elliptica]TDO03830.1 hypothetical protein DET52_102165 [Sunxiuqinia elliptica]TDO62112.1 hypothetical protein DET65_1842 [Sunxiuqinia elliptica]